MVGECGREELLTHRGREVGSQAGGRGRDGGRQAVQAGFLPQIFFFYTIWAPVCEMMLPICRGGMGGGESCPITSLEAPHR